MFEPSREATICSSASPFFLRSQGCVGGHQEAPMEQWHNQKTLGLLGLQPTECWDWTAKLNTNACGLGMFWAWLPSIENLSLMVRWFIMYVKKTPRWVLDTARLGGRTWVGKKRVLDPLAGGSTSHLQGGKQWCRHQPDTHCRHCCCIHGPSQRNDHTHPFANHSG